MPIVSSNMFGAELATAQLRKMVVVHSQGLNRAIEQTLSIRNNLLLCCFLFSIHGRMDLRIFFCKNLLSYRFLFCSPMTSS